MAEQKESSVLFSLKELMSLEESRIREEEEARQRRAEEEVRARSDAERRAREEDAARTHAEEERRRQDELRRKMEEAQIEAAKAAEVEKRRLEEQHRLQMEALAKQQAHERDIHEIQSRKRAKVHPAVLGGVGAVFLAAIVALIYFVSIKPTNDAKEAVRLAQESAASDDPTRWDEALKQIAVAKDKDPTNKDIGPVEAKVQGKRTELQAKKDAALKEYQAKIDSLNADLTAAQQSMASAKSDKERKDALDRIENTKRQIQGARPPVAPTEKKVNCPPGVPLCN